MKSSTSTANTFTISFNELNLAKEDPEHYILYLIIDVNSDHPKFRKIKQFYIKFNSGKFEKVSITLRF